MPPIIANMPPRRREQPQPQQALGSSISACIKFGSVFYLPPPCSSAGLPRSGSSSRRHHPTPQILSHSRRAYTDNFEDGPSDMWASLIQTEWANLVRSKFLVSADRYGASAIHHCCIPRGKPVRRPPPESACGKRARRMPIEAWHIRHLWSRPYTQVGAPTTESCWEDRSISFDTPSRWSRDEPCTSEEERAGTCEEAIGGGGWSKRGVKLDVGALPHSPLPEAWAREHAHALHQLERQVSGVVQL